MIKPLDDRASSHSNIDNFNIYWIIQRSFWTSSVAEVIMWWDCTEASLQMSLYISHHQIPWSLTITSTSWVQWPSPVSCYYRITLWTTTGPLANGGISLRYSSTQTIVCFVNSRDTITATSHNLKITFLRQPYRQSYTLSKGAGISWHHTWQSDTNLVSRQFREARDVSRADDQFFRSLLTL